jgi:hypothetical protein
VFVICVNFRWLCCASGSGSIPQWWLCNSGGCSGVVCSESGADLHIFVENFGKLVEDVRTKVVVFTEFR